MTMDTFCQSHSTTNTQGEIKNVTNERSISLDILEETIKVLNGLTIQSTINHSTYYSSEEDGTESNLKSDKLVATHISDGKKRKVIDTGTTNGNPTQKKYSTGSSQISSQSSSHQTR